MYYIIDRQDDTRQSTAVAQPRTTSGVRFGWSDLARPACRHDPAWRNTGFRTAATACRGGGNARLRSSSLPRRDDIALRTPQGDGSRPPQCDGCIGWKPRGGVPEHNPALTQLCRVSEVPSPTACRRYAPRYTTPGLALHIGGKPPILVVDRACFLSLWGTILIYTGRGGAEKCKIMTKMRGFLQFITNFVNAIFINPM